MRGKKWGGEEREEMRIQQEEKGGREIKGKGKETRELS